MVVIYTGERSLNSYRHRLNLCKGNTSTIEIPATLVRLLTRNEKA
jgi:hypothetical protein